MNDLDTSVHTKRFIPYHHLIIVQCTCINCAQYKCADDSRLNEVVKNSLMMYFIC